VRQARAGESFTSLTNETYTLTPDDAVIIDGEDRLLALAGVKGGLHSGITSETTTIILEAAHFDRVAVRQTAARHRLQTDASKRYENGISRAVVPFALQMATELLCSVAGAKIVGGAHAGECTTSRTPVVVHLDRVNSVLGTQLTLAEVTAIVDRFGFSHVSVGNELTITPSFERDDLIIEADFIEEIGRMYGLDKIVSLPPQKQNVVAVNQRHYYADVIRETLCGLGFSEVYTSSFRSKDIVAVQNALASDKGYLRSTLAHNLAEARQRNIPYRDLLGLPVVKIFEIGTVFRTEDEDFEVALTVQTGTEYKAKTDEREWREAIAALERSLRVTLDITEVLPGVVTFSMNTVLAATSPADKYATRREITDTAYVTASLYPPVSRDIAMWVSEGTEVAVVAAKLSAVVPDNLLVRLTHLDTFTNAEGRTSVAFRLVFQSKQKTLDGSEVDALMGAVYDAAAGQGWEVR
jgi:phenylalanyl-tRNA synthetase beta subunit